MQNTKLTIKLTSDLLEEFKVVAKNQQLSVSALIRLLMLQYLKEHKQNDRSDINRL